MKGISLECALIGAGTIGMVTQNSLERNIKLTQIMDTVCLPGAEYPMPPLQGQILAQ